MGILVQSPYGSPMSQGSNAGGGNMGDGGQQGGLGTGGWTPRSSVGSREPRHLSYGPSTSPLGTFQPRTAYSPQNIQHSPHSMSAQQPHTSAMGTPPGRPSQAAAGAAGSASSQSHQAATSGVADQELIEHAARTMDRIMSKDLQFPTLYKSLTQVADSNVAVVGNRPVSGFMDYDYPPYMQRGIMTEHQFSLVHNAPIPNELNEMLSQTEVGYCHMGLFPEICRAWMTIDSDLYLWDFRDGTDLSFYDGLKETIITMSLVPVKKNVFQHTIQHLLCVSTASEIVILGFVLTDPGIPMSSSTAVMELVSQPIFVVPTEGTIFCVIHGTSNGRILLGAKDGSIHEIHYQAGRGWLTDRCWKSNLTKSMLSNFFKFLSTSSNDAIKQIESDSVRNLLFTRSESGCLQVYDLGQDGNGFTRVGHMTFDGVVNEVVTISKKTLESNIVKKILSISPCMHGEINLVAVLDNGTRLYFSCYNPPSAGLQTVHVRPPYTFQLVHVRMPPGYCTATALQKPSIAHSSFYSAGLFALSARTTQEEDSFWIMSPFMYPSSCLSEIFTVMKLPGRTIEMKMMSGPAGAKMETGFEYFPDVITQHLKWHRDIVVLTVSGTCVFRAHKPFDLLKQLLIERNGPENLKAHFDSGSSRDQPLTNALLLTVHPSTRSEPSVHDMAAKSFFMYGNTDLVQRSWERGRISSPYETTMDFNPHLVSTPRQDGAGGQQYASPTSVGDTSGYVSPPLAGASPFGNTQNLYSQQQQQQQYPGGPMNSPYQSQEQWSFSARHDAIYLVIGRILYNFWNRPLVSSTVAAGPRPTGIMVPNIQGDEVTQAILFLQSISSFITGNPSLFMSRNSINVGMLNVNTPEGRHMYNQELEKNSVQALKVFLGLALEVLNMWKILCDHQFHIVLHGVENQLHNTTMRDLVVTGHGTVSVIINALISKYLGDNAAVDAISLRLREVCPTLFKSEDAIGSKVAEILSKVKSTIDEREREALFRESLMLSEKICGHGRINVRSLCKQYADLGFPVGAIRLCVSAAKATDPDQLALSTVKTTSSNTDAIGVQAFQSRAEIYRIAFDILDDFVQLASTSQSPALRGVEQRINQPVAEKRVEETIHAILTSDDEMFHISLYNWLLEKKQFDRLLEIKHPFLDSFLQRAGDAVVSGKWPGGGISANDTRVLDLLWRHHEMNQNHAAAAQILSKLAESTTTGLNLQQRLEYLSRAVICSKSSSRRGDLLETLEDKVEVAQIQRNILEAVSLRISNMAGCSVDDDGDVKILQEAFSKLNSELLTITQLYTDFAHPFKLNDAKLEIFYAAGHGDKGTIEAVWSDIIEDELANSNRRTMESQMEIIRLKLVSLGRKYFNSPTFFPIEFLIEHLESMKPQDTENVGWVFRTMLEIGVGFPDVLLIYERLWRKLLCKPGTQGGDLQIAKVITFMIEAFTKRELDTPSSFVHKPELLERCKNLIATMIVEFSSRFDTTSTQMTQMLNHVKDRLDRVQPM